MTVLSIPKDRRREDRPPRDPNTPVQIIILPLIRLERHVEAIERDVRAIVSPDDGDAA